MYYLHSTSSYFYIDSDESISSTIDSKSGSVHLLIDRNTGVVSNQRSLTRESLSNAHSERIDAIIGCIT